MAVAGTITKTKSSAMTTEVTISGVTGGNTSPPFGSEGLPFCSAQLSLASGTPPSSVQLQGSNDGQTFLNLGAAITVLPAIIPLTAGPADTPVKFYQFAVTGGDGTTQLSVNAILMGTRG